jgi:hypothetical protein
METETDNIDFIYIKDSTHYTNKKINPRKNKKIKYHDIRSYVSSHKKFRHKVDTELKITKLDEFILPIRDSHITYTWWDCKPYKPKVY